jgi:hypothetical protein
VRDWALKAEQKKLGPPPPKQKATLREMLRRHAERQKENEALRKLLSAWRPRSIEVGRDWHATAQPGDLAEGSPERAALEFFVFVRKGNYGGVVRALDPTFLDEDTVNRLAGAFRTRFANTSIDDVRLLRISDTAPAISVVTVRVDGRYHGEQFDQEVDVRLVYGDSDREVLPRGAEGGAWRLFFLPSLPTDPLDDEDV